MKEKDKVLFAKLLLKITFVMLIISVTIKLLGFNLFEADTSNKILLFISNILDNNGSKENFIKGTFNFLLLLIQNFIFLRLCCRNNNKRTYYFAAIIISIITIFTSALFYNFFNETLISSVYYIFTFSLLILFPIIIDIKIKYETKKSQSIFIKIWNRIKRPIALLLVITVYQVLVMFLRNVTYGDEYETIYNFLLNFDYIILLTATYYIFIKKENNLKITADKFSISSLLNEWPNKEEFKMMLLNLKSNYNKFKKQEKFDKTVTILYTIFFIIQELLTLCLIFFIANLNNYVIECVFILIAFLISKKVFGAFHFKSFILCFFVSNLSFFFLSKITMNVTLTFVIPILCGMLLAYIASLFIKKANATPYRGMSKETLHKMSKNKKLNEIEMNILTDFYCNRESLTKLTYTYNYSQTQICRFKAEAINKLVS